jgi:hypothetical protein
MLCLLVLFWYSGEEEIKGMREGIILLTFLGISSLSASKRPAKLNYVIGGLIAGALILLIVARIA